MHHHCIYNTNHTRTHMTLPCSNWLMYWLVKGCLGISITSELYVICIVFEIYSYFMYVHILNKQLQTNKRKRSQKLYLQGCAISTIMESQSQLQNSTFFWPNSDSDIKADILQKQNAIITMCVKFCENFTKAGVRQMCIVHTLPSWIFLHSRCYNSPLDVIFW